jgi:hypothetical protein
MSNSVIPAWHREELIVSVCACSEQPEFQPLNISPWLAMSLLQKAIRRGRAALARRAAATLLRDSPDRLWRRCGGIAFEDIGVADLNVVRLVTAALAGKMFRAKAGGEWPVASFIVSTMAHASKCRAADDLLLTADLHPDLEAARRELWSLPTAELLRLAAGSGPLSERAVALWYAVGTNRRTSRNLIPRRGEPQLAFDQLESVGFPNSVVAIAREGFRKLGEALCPFVALLHPLIQSKTAVIEDDQLPPETLIGDVPSWAFDMYSREGRAALKAFLQGSSETARWFRAHIPVQGRVGFLGTVVFRVEGGLVRSRLRWPTADKLRKLVDLECHGPHCRDAFEILELMRRDLSILNEARADVCRLRYSSSMEGAAPADDCS